MGFVFRIGVKVETNGEFSVIGVEDIGAVGFGVHPGSDGGFGRDGGATDDKIFSLDLFGAFVGGFTSCTPWGAVRASVGLKLDQLLSPSFGSVSTSVAPTEFTKAVSDTFLVN